MQGEEQQGAGNMALKTLNEFFQKADFLPNEGYGQTSEAPPNEKGGNRYAKPNTTASHLDSTQIIGTGSKEFKSLAVEYKNKKGLTQGKAIKKAAEDLGINLKPSYLQYPGSHFERWRKQGF